MNTDDRILFQMLEPPRGGVARFRRRLGDVDAEARPMPGRRVLATCLAAALIAVIVISSHWSPGGGELSSGSSSEPPMTASDGWTATTVGESQEAPAVPEATAISRATMPSESTKTPALEEVREAPAFARLLGQPLRPTETRIAIDDMQVAVVELPSTNSKVRIYQVSNN
jgi:hypothetical protein